MKSIREEIVFPIHKFFKSSFAISFFLLLIIFSYQTIDSHKNTEFFVKDFIFQLAKSNEVTGNYFLFQSEVDRFSSSLEKYKFKNFKIELILDSKLVAQSIKGKMPIFAIETLETIDLNSGAKLVFKLKYDFFNSISIYLFFGLFIFGLLFLLYFILLFKLNVSLKKLIEPIEGLANSLVNIDVLGKSNQSISCDSQLDEIRILENSINIFLKNIITGQNEIIELKKSEALIDLSKQVAHDIRSPLSALNIVLGSLEGFPIEKQSLIKNATFRINEIANDLLLKAKNNQDKMKLSDQIENQCISNPKIDFSSSILPSTLNFPELVNEIVREKRAQYIDRKDLQIKSDIVFNSTRILKIDPSRISRVISNLVNNSVEACNSIQGEVVISLREYPTFVQLIVSDNGSGILPEVLESIGAKGFTTKSEGNGLGLFHAKQLVEEFGGQFSILSKIGIGTFVTLQFPLHESN